MGITSSRLTAPRVSANLAAPMRNSRRVATVVLVGLALLMSPGGARAAGIEHPDVGTLAIGRGGAYAAAPSDGVAMFYNPAGLAAQEELRLTLDANMAWQGLSFTPQDSSFTPAGAPSGVSNTAGGFLVPALAISYGFGRVGPLPDLTVALGATGPSAIGKENYNPQGPQRYALINSDYFIAYYSAAVAASFTRWLSAGVTFQLVRGSAKFSQAVYSGGVSGNEPGNDSTALVDVTSPFIPTAVFGVTARPIPPLALGLSYRPRYDFLAHGTLDTKLAAAGSAINAMPIGNSTDFFVSFPDVIRFGAQYTIGTRWLVEADFVAELWSRLHTIEIRPQGIQINSGLVSQPVPLPNIIFQKDFQNAYSVRVGGDYVVLPGRLTVRAGYLHETTAIPTRSVNVDFGNWQRDAVSVGGTVGLWRGVNLSVAYAHHFVADQTVTNSTAVQIVSPCVTSDGCAPPAPLVIGNGHYTASLDVASLSLGFTLDPFHRHRAVDADQREIALTQKQSSLTSMAAP